ncbi:ferric reductase like transmembrane component-domain-containing protein [Xylariaceae sp. FL0255]|nr:ferric reductase like transmembrane component-domain-containing protein [Xylariaceae sp. FL0255]
MSEGNSSSIENLPLSDPRCNSDACAAYYLAHKASQLNIPFGPQFYYGHYVAWYYVVVVGLCAIAYRYSVIRQRRPSAVWSGHQYITSKRRKLLAAYRYVQYKQLGRPSNTGWFHLPPLGTSIFFAFTALYLLFLAFLERPYYRGRYGFGSPPLSTRSGALAQALTPLLVALAGKVNIVTFLTGVSHEKLNIFHRWAAYAVLFFSIVHTIPFLAQPVRDGGWPYLRQVFYTPGSELYSGVPALAMLVGLVILSVPSIRNRWYNFFYRVHIPLYITYIGLMFWHCLDTLDSWIYLYVTIGLWFASVATRFFTKWQSFNVTRPALHGFKANAIEMSGGLTKLMVFAPRSFRWRPGSFCYLRFPQLTMFQNHPFSIVSLYQESPVEADKSTPEEDYNTLVFYIRAGHGLTRNLYQSTRGSGEAGRSINVHVDGPYGGKIERIFRSHDSLVFVAGGSGVSACLAYILYHAQQLQTAQAVHQEVHLIWIVRRREHIDWIWRELRVAALDGVDWLHLHFHITESRSDTDHPDNILAKEEASEDGAKSDSDMTENSRASQAISLERRVVYSYGRPNLGELLPTFLTKRKTMIFGCGPRSLAADLSNAAAQAQKKVFAGEADAIALHTESFHW